jgi:hypothetical protein
MIYEACTEGCVQWFQSHEHHSAVNDTSTPPISFHFGCLPIILKPSRTIREEALPLMRRTMTPCTRLCDPEYLLRILRKSGEQASGVCLLGQASYRDVCRSTVLFPEMAMLLPRFRLLQLEFHASYIVESCIVHGKTMCTSIYEAVLLGWGVPRPEVIFCDAQILVSICVLGHWDIARAWEAFSCPNPLYVTRADDMSQTENRTMAVKSPIPICTTVLKQAANDHDASCALLSRKW